MTGSDCCPSASPAGERSSEALSFPKSPSRRRVSASARPPATAASPPSSSSSRRRPPTAAEATADMPPSCAELDSPRALEPSAEGLAPPLLDQLLGQEELCACAKPLEDPAAALGDAIEGEDEASRRLRALADHGRTCSVCSRRRVDRRRSSSVSAGGPAAGEQWELEYRSTGWWMLGVVVALLAALCAFVHPAAAPASASATASAVPLGPKPSLLGLLLHGGEPALLAEREPPRAAVRELLHRAHVAIHSAVRTGVSSPRRPVRAAQPAAAEPAEPASPELLLDIYCRGPLLHAVQMAGVFPDSKHFVDMPIRANSSAFAVLVDFERRALSLTAFAPARRRQPHAAALRAFLADHFDAPGSDLLPVTPADFDGAATPPRLAAVRDPRLRRWAEALHALWRSLGRVPRPHAQSSLLRVGPRPGGSAGAVLVVPGGRFRESYYWDSYWIVHGLLASGMRGTARGVVDGLLASVAAFGFVPNGGRVYYLSRSQPPMLSDMVRLVAGAGEDGDGDDDSRADDSGPDLDYLRAALPLLEREYAFWMARGPAGHAVELEWRDGDASATLVLNRYTSSAGQPRPEAYREDVEGAAELFDRVAASHTDAGGLDQQQQQDQQSDVDEDEDVNVDADADGPAESEDAAAAQTPPPAAAVLARKQQYFNDVIAATESGWDFSSRWLREPRDRTSLATSALLPVDLNAVLFRVERNLARFHALLGNNSRAAALRQAADARRTAMDRVLWSERAGCWRDLDLATRAHSRVVAASDFAPLWAGAVDAGDARRVAAVVAALRGSGLVQVGGVQATTTVSGQQWDAPNAWSPSQDMLVEGLLRANSSDATALATQLARTWVNAGLAAFERTGLMFEKYNASEPGGLGVGGEYFPQFGFGWTNGVILKFLTQYQHLLED